MKNLRGDILNLIYFQNKGLREKIWFGGVRKNDQFGFDLSAAASEGPLSGKMTFFTLLSEKNILSSEISLKIKKLKIVRKSPRNFSTFSSKCFFVEHEIFVRE